MSARAAGRAGVHLVVDDYGAGHSNLARILDLNPEIVKLDGALIRGIDRDPRRQIIVRHMVALCNDLGAKVVAECIETVDELKAVADQGVHYAQGFVLARPAFPPPAINFPLARRTELPSVAKNRPPPKPIARVTGPDITSAPVPLGTASPSVPRPHPRNRWSPSRRVPRPSRARATPSDHPNARRPRHSRNGRRRCRARADLFAGTQPRSTLRAITKTSSLHRGSRTQIASFSG